MSEEEKKPKHWFDRIIGLLCLIAIGAIVVTDNVKQMWVEPPPKWLYIGLFAVATGVTADEAKEFMLTFLRAWAGKEGKK